MGTLNSWLVMNPVSPFMEYSVTVLTASCLLELQQAVVVAPVVVAYACVCAAPTRAENSWVRLLGIWNTSVTYRPPLSLLLVAKP